MIPKYTPLPHGERLFETYLRRLTIDKKGAQMAASFFELHKVQRQIIKALEKLDDVEDRAKVLAAVTALYGQK